MIVIAGGTGTLGQRLVPQLVERRRDLDGHVQDPQPLIAQAAGQPAAPIRQSGSAGSGGSVRQVSPWQGSELSRQTSR